MKSKKNFRLVYDKIMNSHNIVKSTEITDTMANKVSVKFKGIEKNGNKDGKKGKQGKKSKCPIKITNNETVRKVMMNHLDNSYKDIDEETRRFIKKEIS